MIYRGPGFLAFVWLTHPPLPPPLVSKLDLWHTEKIRKRDKFMKGEEEREWGRSQSYESEKAWSSVNHLIFSEVRYLRNITGGDRRTVQDCKLSLIYLYLRSMYSVECSRQMLNCTRQQLQHSQTTSFILCSLWCTLYRLAAMYKVKKTMAIPPPPGFCKKNIGTSHIDFLTWQTSNIRLYT